jgi:dihydroorotate dehydrogenase
VLLRGIEFPTVYCAPGARGFFGEGYPYHRWASRLGMRWEGTGFVSKTITWYQRDGNMRLNADLSPVERLVPLCMVIKPLSGHVLNAVGLSGPGAEAAIDDGRWQARTEPFMISFMPVGSSPEARLEETRLFVGLMYHALPGFQARVAIQLNCACPNTGHPSNQFYTEVSTTLDLLGGIGVPIVVNFNPTVPGEVLSVTAAHYACDALWIGNTIPWGDPRIDWLRLFGTQESPLSRRRLAIPSGGGLSGPACLPHTVSKVLEARQLGIDLPIIAGNGIQRAGDIRLLHAAGASGVGLGVVAMLRPWRMKSIIDTATRLFQDGGQP